MTKQQMKNFVTDCIQNIKDEYGQNWHKGMSYSRIVETVEEKVYCRLEENDMEEKKRAWGSVVRRCVEKQFC